MRPVHILVLLLAGALGGALIMMVANHAKQPTIPTVTAQAQPPATAPPEPAPAAAPTQTAQAPAPAAEPAKAKPSPMPLRREVPKPVRIARLLPVPPFAGNPKPVEQPAPPVGDPGPVEQPAPPPAPAPEVAPAAPPTPPTSPTVAPPPVSADPQVSVPPAPQPHQVTLKAGLLLPVRLVDGLSSERNAPGDVFHGTLDKELVVDGFVIAERGARVEGRVIAADRGGKVRGDAALALELTALDTSDGQTVTIETDDFFKHAAAGHADSAGMIAGGAILGAVIGGMAGGGKGAAIGAGVGAGAGGGAVLLTRGQPAELPSETRVTFRLKTPVPLTEQVRVP